MGQTCRRPLSVHKKTKHAYTTPKDVPFDHSLAEATPPGKTTTPAETKSPPNLENNSLVRMNGVEPNAPTSLPPPSPAGKAGGGKKGRKKKKSGKGVPKKGAGEGGDRKAGIKSGNDKKSGADMKSRELLDPSAYPVERGEEELESIAGTLALIRKNNPTMLTRYRTDAHKIARIVMREVRPKNGYDQEKAARFYAETVRFRETNHIEHLLAYPPAKLSIMHTLIPETHKFMYDTEGHPCLIIRFGLKDGEIQNRINLQEFLLCHTHTLERMERECRRQTKKLKKWINKCRLVIDGAGISIYGIKAFMSYFRNQGKSDTTHYTGLMLSTHVINIPQAVLWTTSLVWPFLTVGVKSKLKLFSQGYEKELLKYFPAEELPVQYGGKREWKYVDYKDIDWNAIDDENRKWALASLDLTEHKLLSKEEYVQKMKVKPGTKVEFYFETDKTPILFEVRLFYANNGKSFMISERSTASCNTVPEKSAFYIFDHGHIEFRWINNYGWSTKQQSLTFGFKVTTVPVPPSDGVLGGLKLH